VKREASAIIVSAAIWLGCGSTGSEAPASSSALVAGTGTPPPLSRPPPPSSRPPIPASAIVAARPTCPEGMSGIPGGDFKEDDGHVVALKAFCIDRSEVTVAAFRKCVAAKKCSAPDDTEASCNWKRAGKENHPVNCVDSHRAFQYCEWEGRQLPSFAQWSWAASGAGEGNQYPWGNTYDAARLCGNREAGTCAVGSFPTGNAADGISDLVGNVSEWTASNVPGKPGAMFTVGGDYARAAEAVATTRSWYPQPNNAAYAILGFRCASEPARG
jgi:formylglycine-generating enzyme required for sulfatase activity